MHYFSNKDKIIFKTEGSYLNPDKSFDADYKYSIYLKKPGSDKLVLLASSKFERREEDGKRREDRIKKQYEIEADAFLKYFEIK